MLDSARSLSATGPESPLGPGVQPAESFVRFERADVEQSIPARFEQQVQRYPGRLAVKTRRHELSYEAFNRLANRIARAILQQDPHPGAPVALLLEHDAPLIAAALAILKAGSFYLPLDPSAPRARLAYMLADSQAALILTDGRNLPLAEALVPGGRRVLNVEAIDAGLADDNLGLDVSPGDLATIIYTSGSTGEPKGVVHDHRAILHAILRLTNHLHVSPDDRLPLLYSFSFSAARHVTYPALLNGAALFPFDLKQEGLRSLSDCFIREGLTLLHWIPTGFRHFVGSLTGDERFPKLRLIILGSEPLSTGDVELYRRHFPRSCIFVNHLAATETGPTRMYFLDHDARLPAGSVPVGYALEDTEVMLLDEAGEPLGPDPGAERTGEVAIRSRYLALGYWRKPELSSARFRAGPSSSEERVFLTGDLGRLRPDGCLEIIGRQDSAVKIRGYRVEPTEVELALLELPAVREAAVVAREEAAGEPRLVAYIVPADPPGPDAAILRELLQSRLPEYMLPSVFVPLEALPLTPNGKLDRRALPAPEAARPDGSHVALAPRSEIEARLVAIWEDLLGVRPIGVRDSFFELGGHSLLAARLFARIEQAFGRHLPLSVLIDGDTIERLASLLEGRHRGGFSSLVPIQPAGSRPPFFCVHPLFGDVLLYQPLAGLLGSDRPFYGLRAIESGDSRTSPETLEEVAGNYIVAIQGVQPRGPYLLGGFSLGGVVAFEMARQLRAAGHDVGLLAVIDSALPELRSTQPQPGADRTEKLIEQLAKLWQWPAHNRELALAHVRMLRSYRPQPYPGRLVFFRTEERSFSLVGTRDAEPHETWGQLAAAVEVTSVPGDHRSLFKEPNIRVLAAELKDRLERAGANVTASPVPTRDSFLAAPGS